jgi:hypothetical protein
LIVEPAVTIPRKADGTVDVTATSQLLNDKVESWVREYPGQWQWFHDRWNIKYIPMKLSDPDGKRFYSAAQLIVCAKGVEHFAPGMFVIARLDSIERRHPH